MWGGAANPFYGARIYVPKPPVAYKIVTSLTYYPSIDSATQFTPGLQMFGDGSMSTKIVYAPTTAGTTLLDINLNTGTPDQARFLHTVRIEGMQITQASNSVAGVTAISIRHAYNVLLEDVFVFGFNGTGLKVLCQNGDVDGSNQIHLRLCRFFGCQTWGVNIDSQGAHNEISFLVMDNCFISQCGANGNIYSAKLDSAFQTGTTVQTTAPSPPPGITGGTYCTLVGPYGTERAVVASLSGSVITFTTTLTFGSYSYFTFPPSIPSRPIPSGGMRYRGQNFSLRATAFAENTNVGLYIFVDSGDTPGAVSVLGRLDNVNFENNSNKHLIVEGMDGLAMNNCRIVNSSFEANTGIFLDSHGSITQFVCDNLLVKQTGKNFAIKMFDMAGTNVYFSHVRNTVWAIWDHAANPYLIKFTPDFLQNIVRLELWDDGFKYPYPEHTVLASIPPPTTSVDTYIPDVSQYKTHHVTVTDTSDISYIGNPIAGGYADGKEMILTIINGSAGEIRVALNNYFLHHGYVSPPPVSTSSPGTNRTSALFTLDLQSSVIGWVQVGSWSLGRRSLQEAVLAYSGAPFIPNIQDFLITRVLVPYIYGSISPPYFGLNGSIEKGPFSFILTVKNTRTDSTPLVITMDSVYQFQGHTSNNPSPTMGKQVSAEFNYDNINAIWMQMADWA